MTNRIKEFRTKRGWSIEDLARESGVSPLTIARYERGETRLMKGGAVLPALAKALLTWPDSLLHEHIDPEPYVAANDQ